MNFSKSSNQISFSLTQFSDILFAWYFKNGRSMPWRGEKDPYKIWISEIILQQTRVNQGWEYYVRFIENFPDIKSLANATLEKVLKVWQGLGYYSRARNLHYSAQLICNQYDGIFPHNYDDILKLKGIGDYTAAAIASIAFDLPYPVVDGNVFRIICRIFGIFDDITLPATKKLITTKCVQLMGNSPSGDFNQAIMDFGAIQCKAQNPLCLDCPFKEDCFAYINQKVKVLPFKKKNIKVKIRYFNYFIYCKNDQIIIQERRDNDIWKNLYEFPLIETDSKSYKSFESLLLKQNASLQPYWKIKHKLTHQIIVASFFKIPVEEFPILDDNQLIINIKEVEKYPFPKIIAQFIRLIS